MILYIKAFHIIFVVSWFAGLFYLPRIFVNIALVEKEHSERNPTASNSEIINLRERIRLILMAKKLFKFITPIMSFAIGLSLGSASSPQLDALSGDVENDRYLADHWLFESAGAQDDSEETTR